MNSHVCSSGACKRFLSVCVLSLAALVSAPTADADAALLGQAPDPETGYILPAQSVQDLFATDPNLARLDNVSPTGEHFLVPLRTELSSLERMAVPTTRLAMLELRTEADRLWHLDTYGIYGFRIFSLRDRAFRDVALPEESFASDFMWSPDGGRLGFLVHLPGRTEVWTVEVESGRVRSAGNARVLATLATQANGQGSRPSDMLQWTDSGSLITLLVPSDRGPEPIAPRVPTGPKIRHSRAEPTPTRTQPFLLGDEHDADLFEYYTTSQIAEVVPGRRPRPIGPPGMYESISLSPDGLHILATRVLRPFSFITSYQGFPRQTEVIDVQSGEVLATLSERPLREGGGGFRGRNGGDGPRDWTWRPDGAGLAYLQRTPSPDEDNDEPRQDRVMLLAAPFDTSTATEVARAEGIRNAIYSRDGRHLFATTEGDGRESILHWDLGSATPMPHEVVSPFDPDELLTHPGELFTQRTANGLEVAALSSDGAATFLRGAGLKEDLRPRPFVDRVALTGGTPQRVFEGSSETFDQPLVSLDDDFAVMVVSREGKNLVPDSYLWSAEGGMANLTENIDPFPAITAARRLDLTYTRRDGLEVQMRVSLPVDYVDGTKVPAIFWTYPREYRSEEDFERATLRGRNHNEYSRLTWLRWSDIWLTQGYALIYPEIPIVGENYNDFYIANMVDDMYAAMRAVDRLGVIDIDRVGHGGHSYGAFATANFLAHTPFFKAGIAGDGAYNRSLTPMGFQAEPRDIWEAPHIYMEISPFFKADQINTPLLMYHGADDNNSGTYPIQSERMMQALTGLGKTAALFVYPFESHTPRALENNLDMWARWLGWFDTYVKGAEKPAVF